MLLEESNLKKTGDETKSSSMTQKKSLQWKSPKSPIYECQNSKVKALLISFINDIKAIICSECIPPKQ